MKVLPCRRFSLAEIKSATNNFDADLLIGEGAFGRVYKGFIGNRTINVAIKRADFESSLDELTNEVVLLCQLHHPNSPVSSDIVSMKTRGSLSTNALSMETSATTSTPINILLDEKLEAKLTDLGLSKLGPPSLSKALIRVKSEVVGTYGYADPGYIAIGELTDNLMSTLLVWYCWKYSVPEEQETSN
uniref:Tyrosine-protein kinase catalytic domain-containing protein n=1 Tax=Quercus lobata TaxID=97700 RepID=A0A7N2LSV2_QUELO